MIAIEKRARFDNVPSPPPRPPRRRPKQFRYPPEVRPLCFVRPASPPNLPPLQPSEPGGSKVTAIEIDSDTDTDMSLLETPSVDEFDLNPYLSSASTTKGQQLDTTPGDGQSRPLALTAAAAVAATGDGEAFPDGNGPGACEPSLRSPMFDDASPTATSRVAPDDTPHEPSDTDHDIAMDLSWRTPAAAALSESRPSQDQSTSKESCGTSSGTDSSGSADDSHESSSESEAGTSCDEAATEDDPRPRKVYAGKCSRQALSGAGESPPRDCIVLSYNPTAVPFQKASPRERALMARAQKHPGWRARAPPGIDYEVDSIDDERDGRVLVVWKPTWVPLRNLNCDRALQDYRRKAKEQRRMLQAA